MSERLDWNAKTVAEFRANEGRVGGYFEGAPMVLVHHRGRKSGREYVNPTMYLPHDTEPDSIYVFATKGGAPTNPDWYHNLTAAALSLAVPVALFLVILGLLHSWVYRYRGERAVARFSVTALLVMLAAVATPPLPLALAVALIGLIVAGLVAADVVRPPRSGT